MLRRMRFYNDLLHHEIVLREFGLIICLLILQRMQAARLLYARLSIDSIDLSPVRLNALISAVLVKRCNSFDQLLFLQDNAFFEAKVALDRLLRLLVIF